MLHKSRLVDQTAPNNRLHPSARDVMMTRAAAEAETLGGQPMTISEERFERFCARRGIPFRRVPEGPTTTPDYEIVVNGIEIVAEIKQIEPNAEDQEILRRRDRTGAAAYWVNTLRPRQSILTGVKQLRPSAKGTRPGVVVLYELVPLLGYLGADNIAHCLYGPREVHIAVPDDPRLEPWVLGSSHGGGRVATEHHNTTLSAVAVLEVRGEIEVISVFHNAFAAMPLDPDRFRFDGVRHFMWQAPDPNFLPCWVELA